MEKTKRRELYTWGLGKHGNLGNGTVNKEVLPYRVNLPKDAGEPLTVSAGGFFSACVTSSGQLYTFGSNAHHRAGHPESDDDVRLPKLVTAIKNVAAVACGDWHTIALLGNGQCYGVGYNKLGALGISGSATECSTFTLIVSLKDIAYISAGQNVSMFIDKTHKVYSAGTAVLHGNSDKANQMVPTLIATLSEKAVVNVSCGYAHCAAVDAEGRLYTWGTNVFFQLGHGDNKQLKVPKLVEALADKWITQVSCTRSDKYCHTSCIDKDGAVYTWGSGCKGKLGHADSWSHADPADEKVPKKIEFLKDVKIKETIAAGLHSAALSSDGVLYTFGCGSDGRLGHADYTGHKYLYREALPRAVDSFKGKTVIAATSAYYHMMAIAS